MIEFLKDVFRFLRSNRNYWLAPIFVALILVGTLIVTTQGSVLAPFIYTLF